jgi:1-acyl-sn-glycerol-3-phosphate acyltransferase
MSDSHREKPKRLQAVRRSVFWWTVSRFAVLMFSKLWFRIRCEGVESLPENGSVLLVANHASYLDPGMVGITATRWVGFLAQAGLASLAPCRWWLAQVGVTLIDRNAPSKESMRLVADCLKAGDVVGIFPEGTRSDDGCVHEFKGGVEFLVRRTKTTVVPIGIDGSHRAFPRGSWFPRPRKIVVRYGEPWTAEQILAPGGVEALRRKVAELARCPLAAPRAAEVLAENREIVPGSAALPANSTGQTGAQVAGGNATERSGKGSAAGFVDPPSTSASAGGGA